MACHCEGKGWKFWGDSNLKSKFWGQSIQLDPSGVLTLQFDDGETFQWSKVQILHWRQNSYAYFLSIFSIMFVHAWSRDLEKVLDILLSINTYHLFILPWQVTTTINNLIIGRVYCHHHGTMNISGNRQYSCKLTFKEQSFLDRNPRQV